MELKWLEDLVALLEEKSFSKAAARRNITQSAFSRRIQSLEEWFGCQLVDRQSKPIKLLDSAFSAGPHIWSMVNQFYELRNRLRIKTHPLNEVRILGEASALDLMFEDVILSMPSLEGAKNERGESAPLKITVSDASTIVNAMHRGEVEIVCYCEGKGEFLGISETLYKRVLWGKDSLIACAASSLMFDTSRDGNSMTKLPLVTYSDSGILGELIKNSLDLEKCRHYKFVQFGNVENALLAKQILLKSSSIAWMPRGLVKAEIADGRLVDLSNILPSVDLEYSVYVKISSPLAISVYQKILNNVVRGLLEGQVGESYEKSLKLAVNKEKYEVVY